MIGKEVLINPKEGRRLVVSDVHGCPQTLKTLVLEKVNLGLEDQLFLLGDYLDRGPDNAGVLDFILELQDIGCQVFPLRGNHEEYVLKAWKNYLERSSFSPVATLKSQMEAVDLVEKSGQLKKPYADLLTSLPYFYELDRFILVHAGLNFLGGRPLEDTWHMTHLTTQGVNLTGKAIVHGHQITPLPVIKRAIAQRQAVIPLDNGCYQGFGRQIKPQGDQQADFGNLCCLNLDTLELVVQRNVE
jgi:serine/threonine protein phosphatase 1